MLACNAKSPKDQEYEANEDMQVLLCLRTVFSDFNYNNPVLSK